MLQKIPPIAPKTTIVANVVGELFGNPKRGPNKGIIEVIQPTGMRIFSFNSGKLARFHISLMIKAERVAKAKKPQKSPAKDPGSVEGRTNTPSMNMANNAPVAPPDKIMCLKFS